MTQKVLDERGAEVEAVIRALIKISRDFAADPNAWAAAMVPYAPNTDEAGPADAGRQPSPDSWSVNGGMNRDRRCSTPRTGSTTTEDFASVAPVTIDQWVDFGPVDAVLADARYRRERGSRRPMRHEHSTGERVRSADRLPAVAAIELEGVGVSFRSARLKSEIVALNDINLCRRPTDLRHACSGPRAAARPRCCGSSTG